jgi:hypothetical protein
MLNFKLLEGGYHGRLVAHKETGLIGRIRDKTYNLFYEVDFEYTESQIELILDNPEYNRPIEECFEYSPFPNRKFCKGEDLILLD